VHTLDHEPSDRVEAPVRFAPGTTIGHFRVVRELGAGGMGVVFEAHDPDLDRRVAIKVVKGGVRSNLLREAQAMARLTHPNVVTVHEVGTIDSQVFVVMELVPGGTLATWLATPRPWREIVATFVAAGRGLLAAHHAGLVHRDFKPTNVLVDPTGRARVSDFGLAHGDDQLAEGSSPAGTLAYMAPEQRSGGVVDARADQYAFAIALQEALGPKHALGTPPRKIRAAIVRALEIDPDVRFTTMAELIAELDAPLHTRRRTAAIAIGGTAIAGIAAFALLDTARSGDISCADGASLVDRVWSPAVRAGQLARFVAHAPHASAAIGSGLGLVDDWAQTWKLGRRAACAVGEPQRTARLGCLDRGLHELRAQLAVWAAPDLEIAGGALRTAAALPSVDACAAEVRDAPVSPIVLDRITKIDALVRSGRAPATSGEIEPALVLATTTGNPRDLAAALVSGGKAELENGALQAAHDHFARAAQAAGKANDDGLLVEALLYEAKAATELGHPNDGLGLLDAADAIEARGATAPNIGIAVTRGDALHAAGRTKEAIAVLRPVVAAAEARAARDPKDRIDLSTTLGQLASVLLDAEDFTGAREIYRRCVALDEASFGPDHPEVAKSLSDLSVSEYHLDQLAESRAHLERAKRILAAVYGDHGLIVGKLALVDANLAGREHRDDAAIASLERAKVAFTGVLESNHPYFGIIEESLAERLRAQDKCAAALPHTQRALQLLEHSGTDPKHHALELVELGACLADVDRLTEAQDALHRALGEMTDLHMTLRWFSEPDAVLAEIAFTQGHKAEALALMKTALAATAGDTSADIKALHDEEQARIAEWSK
jgi:eukaryotic-like serine/threonine-protein kinase